MDCHVSSPTNPKFHERFTSCIVRVKENFTVLDAGARDYDPRIGFKVGEDVDVSSMYQCYLSPQTSYYMIPLSKRSKIPATIDYNDENSKNPRLICTTKEMVHNIGLSVSPCSSVSDCDLKYMDIYPHVSFLDSRNINDSSQSLWDGTKRLRVFAMEPKISGGFVQCDAVFRPIVDQDILGYVHEVDYIFTGLDKKRYLLSKGIPANSAIFLAPNFNIESTVLDNFENFRCDISPFVLTSPLYFETNYSNGISSKFKMGSKNVQEVSRNELSQSWQILLKLTVDLETVACYALNISSGDLVSAALRLNLTGKEFQQKPEDPNDNIMKYMAIGTSVAASMFLGMGVLVLILWRKYSKSKNTLRKLTKAEIDEFYSGNSNPPDESSGNWDQLGFNADMIIASARLRTSEDILGQGQFGIVCKGKLDNRDVAVKSCKSNADIDYLKAFLKELKVMAYVGEHENIVKFHGAVVDRISERKCYAVVELSPMGNLNQFLKNNATSAEGCNLDAVNLNQLQLVRFCRQIAAGMEFLSQKQVVHADLATRNILVFPNNAVKVSDFGLARKLYDCTNYVKTKQTPLPWRWMALESLRYFHFSTKSDIWSYGVTTWEIFSLAHVPFSGASWTPEFADEIQSGLRLAKPHYADQNTFNWMMKCWDNDPEQRPTFSDCRIFFANLESVMAENDPNYLALVETPKTF